MRVTVLLAWLLASTLSLAAPSGSARIELAFDAGLIAEADYWPGAAEQPAVLILHGFLQTRELPAVRRLAEALAGEGFSVLTPSLSLDLNRRHQGLACEAVHTHTLHQDVAELAAWTRWLAGRAGKAPVVVAYSAGAVQLAAMLDTLDTPVARALLIDMTSFERAGTGDRTGHSSGDAGADRISTHQLGFCARYASTVAASESYLRWDRDRLQQALLGARVPVAAVIGGDGPAAADWRAALENEGMDIRTIPGADHFFGLAHQTALLHEVLDLIRGNKHG